MLAMPGELFGTITLLNFGPHRRLTSNMSGATGMAPSRRGGSKKIQLHVLATPGVLAA